jgi:glutathione S-transferase
MLTVYWGSGSQYSWRVLLALEWKKIPYESRLIQFSTREHKSPEFLRLNPRGKVPTIVDGDFALGESLAILAYVDAKWPDPPIFGRTPEEKGRVMKVVAEQAAYVDTSSDDFILPLYAGKGVEKAETIKAAGATLLRELDFSEAALAKTQFLAGDVPTAADFCAFPNLQSICRAAGKESAKSLDLGVLPLAERFPNLASWVKRIESIPGYERTYPPHWK